MDKAEAEKRFLAKVRKTKGRLLMSKYLDAEAELRDKAQYLLKHNVCSLEFARNFCALETWLMSWHRRHPRVTRNDIADIVMQGHVSTHNNTGLEICRNCDDQVMRLLALINGQPEWCEHIAKSDGLWKMTDRQWKLPMEYGYQFCPICGAPKPDHEAKDER